MLVEYNIHKNA